MADEIMKDDELQRSRIELGDDNAIEELKKEFPKLDHEQLVSVIRQAGPLKADIVRELELVSEHTRRD